MCTKRVSSFLLLCALLSSPLALADVWAELSAAGPCGSYQPMTTQQLTLAESLFRQILEADQVSEAWLAREWSPLGYAPLSVAAAGDDWIGLRDVEAACRGQGVFLINRRPRGGLVVQAPHAYQDLDSGRISGRLLRETIAVLAWNSAKRSVRTGRSDVRADLARRRDSLFIALTRALAEARPRGRLVQIHGFDRRKRATHAGSSAAAIVSSGSRWSTSAVEDVAACLQAVIEGPVLVYPRDVAELGATRNAQGQTLRSHGHQGFVHLELSRRTRERLRSDPARLAEFSDCLGTGLN